MADRPILFSAPMVRALLDGRKTQTRRVLKLGNRRPEYIGPKGCTDDPSCWGWSDDERGDYWLVQSGNSDIGYLEWSDWQGAYAPGDRLWVREAHAILPATAYRGSIGSGTIAQIEHPTDGHTAAVMREGFDRSGAPRWRPSIHMPRWASRVTLHITDLRVQRLQDITLGDICAEGLARSIYDFRPVQRGFDAWQALWDSLNADRAPWASNPWICALTFTVQRGNIDQVEGAA